MMNGGGFGGGGYGGGGNAGGGYGGGGGFGGGGRGGGGGGRGGGKAGRRATQQATVARKANEETTFFWAKREKALSAGGRAPLTAEQVARAERELFSSHNGVVGINFQQYEAIPVEVSGPGTENTPALATFQDLGPMLPPFLTRDIELMRYKNPTPIQKNAIPHALAGKDLMCCAQTGSGKTCAFLLPVAASLGGMSCSECGDFNVGRQDPEDSKFYCDPCWDKFAGVEMGPSQAYAVVMAPTRELALQIHIEARKLTHGSSIHPVVVYGGAAARGQLEELALGGQILVATPGRLIDFVDRGVITLSKTRFLVLDEADRMLDMGFEPQIRQVVQKRDMPTKDQRQTLMFSATFPGPIQKLAAEFMNNYVWIAVGRVGSSVESITQVIIQATADKRAKLDLAVQALATAEGRTLIFVQKKATADWVSKQLKRNYDINADAIHGDRNQSQREGVLAAFRAGKIRVMVATDVAARGLDIPEVTHVINFDMPTATEEFDSYVHRIGRTGRAGHVGKATGFYVPGFDPKTGNGKIAKMLVQLLTESNMEVPEWMMMLPELNGAAMGGGGGGGGGGGKGGRGGGKGAKFGGRDVRGQGNMQQQRNGNFQDGNMNQMAMQMQQQQAMQQMIAAMQQQMGQQMGGMQSMPGMGFAPPGMGSMGSLPFDNGGMPGGMGGGGGAGGGVGEGGRTGGGGGRRPNSGRGPPKNRQGGGQQHTN